MFKKLEELGDVIAGVSDSEDPPKKKRGRVAGSTTKKKTALSNDSIATALYTAHAMIAGFIQVPELMLEEQESKNLADAVAKVAEQYDLELSPQTQAWINLAMVTGAIYGSRYYFYAKRKSEEKANTEELTNA